MAQAAAAAVLWGTSFPVVEVGISAGLDPRTFVFLRFAMAAPILVAACRLTGRKVSGLLRSPAVWCIAFMNSVGFVCQFLGQGLTSASVAALLVNQSVILAAIGGTVFLGEGASLSKVSGVLLALAGTALVATDGNLSSLGGAQLAGVSLYLVAAVSWAGYIVYSKKKLEEERWDPFGMAAAVVVATGVFTLPVALTAGFSIPGPLASEAILYTTIFNTAIPFVLYQRGLEGLTATAGAVTLMLEVIVAVVLSSTFLGEAMTGYAWAGAVAIIASIVLVSRTRDSGKSLSVGGASVGGTQMQEP